MNPTQAKAFVHRHRDNGAIESICMCCFSTIYRCFDLEEIQQQEAEHVCQDNSVPAPFYFNQRSA
jgi:hypothetical protein